MQNISTRQMHYQITLELRVLVTRQVQVEADDAVTALQIALQQEHLNDERVLHTAAIKPLGPFPPGQV